MVLAVLEARCGLALAGQEVYLNVAGGLRIGEPAADLAVAAALVSAATGQEVPEQTVIFGEIGLSVEIRPVSQVDLRLQEAADRKRVVSGKRVYVRVDLGGRRIIKKKQETVRTQTIHTKERDDSAET